MDIAVPGQDDVRLRRISHSTTRVGAEETFWLATRSARTAIAAALAELVSEGAFSEEKALELAHMYLHDNAAKLYGAKP